MNLLYETIIHSGAVALSTAHHLPRFLTGSGKNRMFVDGQAQALRSIAAEFTPADENYWFHCSSLGEYGIARPIIDRVRRERPDARIALTIFSPTGVNALKNRRHSADYVGYLPIDTPAHARQMIEIVKPTAVAFMVSEYWPNYLTELKRRDIPTYLVSAIFSRRTPHFSPLIGSAFRQSLDAYTRIFVLDRQSCANLAELGFERVTMAGDPLMDNAVTVAATEWADERIEAFCRGHRVMIAGSISDANDLRLCAAVANRHPDRRFVFVPHEVDDESLRHVEKALTTTHCRLSAYNPETTRPAVLIVDNVGSLALLYRYGAMAYIGGGFTSQLHSMIEATAYGLPTAFGPRTERKVTPAQLCALGIGRIVETESDLEEWYDQMYALTARQAEEIKQKALEYCRQQSGATQTIAETIIRHQK